MKQRFGLVAALSINGVFGEGGEMPWYIPADFKHFKDLTTEWTVIMGRGTWESLPQKFRPLPHRENIVVTTNESYVAQGAKVCSSFEQAVARASTEKVFFIGGRDIWYRAMDIIDDAWITVVQQEYPITPSVTRVANELLNPPSYWSHISFNEMLVDEEAHGAIPGFKIIHWVNTKKDLSII